MTDLLCGHAPGVRQVGRKGGSLRTLFFVAQVDSVLSADGRRPVRRGQYIVDSQGMQPAVLFPLCEHVDGLLEVWTPKSALSAVADVEDIHLLLFLQHAVDHTIDVRIAAI